MKIIKFCFLGAVGVLGFGLSLASPTSARPLQAYASGGSSIILMNGAGQSIGGEIAAPKGAVFEGATLNAGDVNVGNAPGVLLPITLDSNSAAFFQLQIDPGDPSLAPAANANMEAAVATQITNASVPAEGVSYTRAWRSGNSGEANSSVQAYVSGSSSMILMNGATQSIGGEIAAPQGAAFTTPLDVSPNFIDLSTNTTLLSDLIIQPGAISPTIPASNANVEAAVATQITNANVADGVSYTRAWQSGVSSGATATYLQAYASGSSSLVLMNGASESIGGEIAAPKGAAFLGTLNVTLAFQGTTPDLSGNTVNFANLTVDPGSPTGSAPATASVEAAVATKINTAGAANLSDGVSYTRAWQGGLQ